MSSSGILIAALGVVILCSSFRPRRFAPRGFALLRAVFPTWRFFDEIGPVPTLYYRVALPGEELGEWRRGIPPLLEDGTQRGLGQLLLNPQGNLNLAKHALVNQLISDSGENAEAAGAVISMKLVHNLIRDRIHVAEPGKGSLRYQFKIAVLESDAIQELDAIVSEVLEIHR